LASSDGTFLEYVSRVLKRLNKDAASWARDNIFWGIVMLLAPLAVLYWQQKTIDWGLVQTTLWIYLAAFVIYLCIHLIRTPWKLDVDRAIAIQTIAGQLKLSQEALSNRSPNFLITPRRLWVTPAAGWIDKTHGVVASLEVHIVNTSPAPGNIQDIDISVNLAGGQHSGVPIAPMYFCIYWRKDKAPEKPTRPDIEVYPKDFLYELIDGEVLTQNRGTIKWLPFYVDAEKAEVESSTIAISIKDATGKEFRAVSFPDSSRQLENGYR